ncbi:hypothetical protein OL239_17360 [Arthrobacter sp. ATA002]|uniref:hypothetical protein n=1 Tax=Arthrobacter sp. ATA002 TaxID=2991715 RepID=UPI0022A68A86|nr:hypothetical protein [Arthrobacter sp. ATA002]WAP51534.1 hypothetical protein OL239_17360 [Arthrobacter sp. ATA002]
MNLTTTLHRIDYGEPSEHGATTYILHTAAGAFRTEPDNMRPRALALAVPVSSNLPARPRLTLVLNDERSVVDWQPAAVDQQEPDEVSLDGVEWDGHFGLAVDYYDTAAAAAAAPDTRWSVVRGGAGRSFLIAPTADYAAAFRVARNHNLSDDYRADTFDDRYIVIQAALAEWACYAAEGPREETQTTPL